MGTGSDLVPTPTKQARLSGSSTLVPPTDHSASDEELAVKVSGMEGSDDGVFEMSPTVSQSDGHDDPWLVPNPEPQAQPSRQVPEVPDDSPTATCHHHPL